MRPIIPAYQRVQIAARIGAGVRTVDRAYAGETVYETTRARIERAAAELGLPPPPPAKRGRRLQDELGGDYGIAASGRGDRIA